MTLSALLTTAGVPVPELVTASDARAADTLRTVVVWGPVGVGKTTLVNGWTSTDAPTGLGGVTTVPRTLEHRGLRIVDLPALNEGDPVGSLSSWVLAADVALHITDGLRPLARPERRAAAAFRGAGVPCPVLVGRADLLHLDAAEVLERVRSHTPEGTPIHLADLRTSRGPDAAQSAVLASPRTARHTLAHAAALAALEALGHGPSADALHAQVRDAWQHHVATVRDALHTELQHNLSSVQAVHERLHERTPGGPAAWGGLPSDLEPPTPAMRVTTEASWTDLLNGRVAARRALDSTLVDWMTEGQLAAQQAVEDWLDADSARGAAARGRALARDMLQQRLPAAR